jgi:TolB-like protein
MAPELFVGKSATSASDIYGLGVLLFELLTGRRPYAGATSADLALQVLAGPTPEVSALAPSVPARLGEVVSRAMSRDPASRYASAALMAEDLRGVAAMLSGVHAEPPPVTTGGSPARAEGVSGTRRPRRRQAAALALGLVLAGLALAGYLLWPGRSLLRTPTVRSRTVVGVLPLSNLTGDTSRDYVGVGISEALTTALAGLESLTVKSGGLAAHVPLEPARAARELGATLIVGGSVTQAGDLLRFSVRVAKADGSIVWAREYDGAGPDQLRLQRVVVDDVVKALNVTVSPGARVRLERDPAASLDAYVEYARGRTLLERRDVGGNVDRSRGVRTGRADGQPVCPGIRGAVRRALGQVRRHERPDLGGSRNRGHRAGRPPRSRRPTHPGVARGGLPEDRPAGGGRDGATRGDPATPQRR